MRVAVDNGCGFAAVGEVDGAPSWLEGGVFVDVGEGLVAGGVLVGSFVVGEKGGVEGVAFGFDLDAVFGEFSAAFGEGVLAEGGEFLLEVWGDGGVGV